MSNAKGEAAGTHLNLNNGLFTLASTRWLCVNDAIDKQKGSYRVR